MVERYVGARSARTYTHTNMIVRLDSLDAYTQVLFQTGPGNSWIAESYANAVPYPHGSSVYQDVFQSGRYLVCVYVCVSVIPHFHSFVYIKQHFRYCSQRYGFSSLSRFWRYGWC